MLSCVSVFREEILAEWDEVNTIESIRLGSPFTVDARNASGPITGSKELSRTVSLSVSGSIGFSAAGWTGEFEVAVGESYTETYQATITANPGEKITIKFGSHFMKVSLKRFTVKRRADGTIWQSTKTGTASGTTGAVIVGG